MPISNITNGESGSDTRTSLNQVIDKVNDIEAGADVTDAENVGPAIGGATVITTFGDTDQIPVVQSNVLKSLAYSALKTLLNAIYQAKATILGTLGGLANAAGFLTNDGAGVLSYTAVGTGVGTALGVNLGSAGSILATDYAADAGSTDAYAATLNPAPAALVVGAHYRFMANTANTGAATINFNSLGAKTIVKAAGGITTALADNDIRAGQWVDVVWDGTNMQMQSTLGNAGGGLSPPTLAGINSITSATGQDLNLATLDSNKDITLTPHGTGQVIVPPGTATKPGLSLGRSNTGLSAETPSRLVASVDGVAAMTFYPNRVGVGAGGPLFPDADDTVDLGFSIPVYNLRFKTLFLSRTVSLKATTDPTTLPDAADIYGKDVSGTTEIFVINEAGAKTQLTGTLIPSGLIRLKGYTVGTLPTGTQGDIAFVTDALAPVSLATVASGGSAVVKVFYDGTNWIVQ